ncbi:hypothetical protein Mpsy_2281 [Methanolobus psychrophilus R15]|nr:hypothetical protein Mpsy_2281 [Methanolobus psychrophilus R15]
MLSTSYYAFKKQIYRDTLHYWKKNAEYLHNKTHFYNKSV